MPRSYAIDEFAEELGVHPETVKRWCRSGDLDYTRTPGGDRRIPRCDNARCEFEGDRDYVAAVNVARVFFSETDGLDHGFTSSYTGDLESVPARRSAGEGRSASRSTSETASGGGTRLSFGSGIVAYSPGHAAATAGGGSAVIAPAVALPESNADGSDECGPATHQYTQFQRVTAEHC